MAEEAIRFRKLRDDAGIASVCADLERKLGLPFGCLKFIKPDGRFIRSDAKVRTLRAAWDD